MTRERCALITGVTGQDGILLAGFLRSRGYRVVGFGRRMSLLERADLRSLLVGIVPHYGDLSDTIDLVEAIRLHQPDEIYNLAAQSAPGLSWAQALETGEVTAIGAHRVLEAVRRVKPDCRVYQASSSEMFGAVLSSPQDETTPFLPANPYAAAKVYAHMMAGIYRKSYGMFAACGILFNHESRYRSMRFLSQKVTYAAACAKLGIATSPALNEEGEPVVRDGKVSLGNLDAVRDWGAAADYVRAMWLMLQQDEPDDYVVGTGVPRTVRDLCASAFGAVGRDWRDHVVTDERFMRRQETGTTIANAGRARVRLGWRPEITFVEMIDDMISANLARIRATATGT